MSEWKPNIVGITKTLTGMAEDCRNRADMLDQISKCFNGREVRFEEPPKGVYWRTIHTNADWMWSSFGCDVLTIDGTIHFVRVGGSPEDFHIYTDSSDGDMTFLFGESSYEWVE